MKRNSGFTLIEMMTVVVIIAIVASITMASAQYLVRNSRRQRARVTCISLETALSRYRHEYNEWPGLPGSVNEDDAKVVFWGTNNKNVLSPLRQDHKDNKYNIRFIDESAMLTAKTFEKSTSALADTAEGSAQPFAYRDPKTGHARFYKVTVNLDDDTVSVDMCDSDANKTEVIDRDDK